MISLRCYIRSNHLTITIQGSPQYTYGHVQPNSLNSQYSAQGGTSQYPTQGETSPYAAQSSAVQAQSNLGSNTLRTSLHTGPAENITDGDLFQKGARARGMIKGTKGEVEELDDGKEKIPSYPTQAHCDSLLYSQEPKELFCRGQSHKNSLAGAPWEQCRGHDSHIRCKVREGENHHKNPLVCYCEGREGVLYLRVSPHPAKLIHALSDSQKSHIHLQQTRVWKNRPRKVAALHCLHWERSSSPASRRGSWKDRAGYAHPHSSQTGPERRRHVQGIPNQFRQDIHCRA